MSGQLLFSVHYSMFGFLITNYLTIYRDLSNLQSTTDKSMSEGD